MNIKELFLAISFGALVALCTIYFLDSDSQKIIQNTSGRLPASVKTKSEQDIPFLSKSELFLLKPKEKKAYLNLIARTITRAKKISKVVKRSNIVFNEAWANVTCPIQGLHPSVQETKAGCKKQARGFVISNESVESFHPNFIGTLSGGQKYVVCPRGQKMCSPTMVGFENHGDNNKKRLRCLPEATNEKCLALKTTGENIEESLNLLDKANPDFWNEFASGVNELCLDDGKFNDDDEGCNAIRRQMKKAMTDYRSKLNQRYKDLAAAIKTQELKRTFSNKQACKERGIHPEENLHDFNTDGIKFIVSGDVCFRVPATTRVRQLEDGTFRYYQMVEYSNQRERDMVQLSELQVGADRFLNFNCGACNKYLSIERCLEELEKTEPDMSNLINFGNAHITMTPSQCVQEFLALRKLEVSDEVLRNVVEAQNREAFWETGAIR